MMKINYLKICTHTFELKKTKTKTKKHAYIINKNPLKGLNFRDEAGYVMAIRISSMDFKNIGLKF